MKNPTAYADRMLPNPGTKGWEKAVQEAIKAGTKITLSENCKKHECRVPVYESTYSNRIKEWKECPKRKKAQNFLTDKLGD